MKYSTAQFSADQCIAVYYSSVQCSAVTIRFSASPPQSPIFQLTQIPKFPPIIPERFHKEKKVFSSEDVRIAEAFSADCPRLFCLCVSFSENDRQDISKDLNAYMSV